LKLAYAITIHKSQWMTFDNCKLDISNIFAGWQAYTALSRARSLSGISLSWKIKHEHLFFDDRIKEFVDKYLGD
jgi:ATP-dependent exoDNAse (exonuclease V) alpha subunit